MSYNNVTYVSITYSYINRGFNKIAAVWKSNTLAASSELKLITNAPNIQDRIKYCLANNLCFILNSNA